MANKRIKELTATSSPLLTDKIAVDGTTTRSVTLQILRQSLLGASSNVLYATDFGYKADSTDGVTGTDNASFLNDAIEEASNMGGNVAIKLPSGKGISSPLDPILVDNVWFSSDGAVGESVLSAVDSAGLFTFGDSSHSIVGGGFNGIGFIGNANASQTIVKFSRGDELFFNQCKLVSGVATLAKIGDATNTAFNCIVHGLRGKAPNVAAPLFWPANKDGAGLFTYSCHVFNQAAIGASVSGRNVFYNSTGWNTIDSADCFWQFFDAELYADIVSGGTLGDVKIDGGRGDEVGQGIVLIAQSGGKIADVEILNHQLTGKKGRAIVTSGAGTFLNIQVSQVRGRECATDGFYFGSPVQQLRLINSTVNQINEGAGSGKSNLYIAAGSSDVTISGGSYGTAPAGLGGTTGAYGVNIAGGSNFILEGVKAAGLTSDWNVTGVYPMKVSGCMGLPDMTDGLVLSTATDDIPSVPLNGIFSRGPHDFAGSTSGKVRVQAPAIAGTSALTLPAETGTLSTQAYADLYGKSFTSVLAPTYDVAMFQEATSSADKSKRVFRSDTPASHSGVAHYAAVIENHPYGSGQNGPTSADITLGLSGVKKNFTSISATAGEMDVLSIGLRNGGPDSDGTNNSDGSALIVNALNIGNSGYVSANDWTTGNQNRSFAFTKQVHGSFGAINSLTTGQQSYGYLVTATIGANDDAYRVQSTVDGTTGYWNYALNVYHANAQVAFVTGRGVMASNAGFQFDSGTKTATATAGAATLNKLSGVVTTEALTTAAAAKYTLTLTNSKIAAADIVLAKVENGTNSAGRPVVGKITEASGSVTIDIENTHASAALNGTLVISYAVFKD